jgi:uncharacterized damage-inducible protein DinB
MMARMKSFIVAVTLVLVASIARAQTPSAETYTGTLTRSWQRVARIVAASAEAMPEAGYSFKPSPEVRTFGELIGHLAEEHYMICAGAKGEKNPKDGVAFEKIAAKPELVKAINDSIAYCNAVYSATKDEAKTLQPAAPNRRDTSFSSLLLNVTHDSEHYGNLVTYLRMKGIVPPSSQPTR